MKYYAAGNFLPHSTVVLYFFPMSSSQVWMLHIKNGPRGPFLEIELCGDQRGLTVKNVLLFLTGKNKPTMNAAEQKQNHVVRFQNKYSAGVIFQRTLPGENCLFPIRTFNLKMPT